jgi:hypothetical protein
MVQVLDEPYSAGAQFGAGLGRGLGQIPKQFADAFAMKKENEALEKMGIDLRGISDPKTRETLINRQLSNQAAQQEKQAKAQENLAPLEAGIKTIQTMRDIGKKGRLGRGSGISGSFGGVSAKDRSEYERLGKSLISLSSNIPIRNKAEFETLASDLYDPSLPDETREGILNAMEQIIEQNMAQYKGGFAGEMRKDKPQKSERPPLSSFKR